MSKKNKAALAADPKATKVVGAAMPAVLNCPHKGKIKLPKPTTKRMKVIVALRDGLSREALVKLIPGWSVKNSIECLRILHNEYGFGFATKDGIIRILEPKDG